MTTYLAITRGDVADYVDTLAIVYLVLIFIRILTSWIPRMPYNRYLSAFLKFISDVTDPYLNLFRYHWQRGVYGEKPFNARSYVLQELAKGTQGPYVCKPWKPEPKEAA